MDGKTVNLKEFVHIVPEDNLLDGLPKGSPRWNENSPCYKVGLDQEGSPDTSLIQLHRTLNARFFY
jgi:hypothetical protein